MLKKMLHFSFVLGIICSIAIFGVSLVYSTTFESINKKEEEKKQSALAVILAGLVVDKSPVVYPYQGKEEYLIYLGRDPKTNEIKGWGLQSGEQGYSSVVQTMIGFDDQDKVIAIEIVFQQETPGLGAECVSTGVKKLSSLWSSEKEAAKRPWFQSQFSGKEEKQLDLKAKEGIRVISGSTITSNAITNSVKKALKIVQAYRNEAGKR
ncbi:MAG: FMN-binding protein [Candidatus Brocadiae bacterium]|nr:FMN-binding protein [Candidatus Brocadiia bacterium]